MNRYFVVYTSINALTSVDVRSSHTLGVVLGRHFGTANFEMDTNIF